MKAGAFAAVGVLLGVAGWMIYRAAQGEEGAAADGGGFLKLVFKVENVVYDAMGARRSMSRGGVEQLQRREAFSPTPYQDQAGYWTIGYGHKIVDGESFTSIDQARAAELLAADLAEAEDAVNSLVKVPLSQAQFDALVSFTFNVGAGALRSSTLLRRLNDGDYSAVPAELQRWRYVTVNGEKVESRGLVARRAEEAAQFGTA